MASCPNCNTELSRSRITGTFFTYVYSCTSCDYAVAPKLTARQSPLVHLGKLRHLDLPKFRLSHHAVADFRALSFLVLLFSAWQLSLASHYVHSLYYLFPLAAIDAEHMRNVVYGSERCGLCNGRVRADSLNMYNGKQFCSPQHLAVYSKRQTTATSRRGFVSRLLALGGFGIA